MIQHSHASSSLYCAINVIIIQGVALVVEEVVLEPVVEEAFVDAVWVRWQIRTNRLTVYLVLQVSVQHRSKCTHCPKIV